MKNKYIILLALLYFFTSCSNSTNIDYDKDFELMTNTVNIKEAVALANDWKTSKPKIVSYITSKELIITFPDKRKIIKKLPVGEMYIAVAPYLNETHTCSTHYLSSCQGELQNYNINISIVDTNGNLVYKGNLKTLSNGFFELWLIRDSEFIVKINNSDSKAEFKIQTYENSKTCVTDVQLK